MARFKFCKQPRHKHLAGRVSSITMFLLSITTTALPLLALLMWTQTAAAAATAPGSHPVLPNSQHLQHLQQHSHQLQQLQPQAQQQRPPNANQAHQQHQAVAMAFGQTQSQPQENNPNNPYTNATYTLLLDLRQQLLNRLIKFDEHFRNLLRKSKIDLHHMFMDTYGMIYLHNTEIFTGMYESLERYYAKGDIQLTKLMESFFERLYQKIFQVWNSNRAFGASYLECATEQLAQLKPFKDAPEKLITDIRHAFVAARTFNQALNSGIDIIKSLISLGQPAQCTNLISEKLLKPARSSPDSSASPREPCPNFCLQVISRCYGRMNLEPLDDRWRAYVSSLGELAKKLSVQYNVETIIGPIDVQISEAIMNFQENAPNITNQVYQACGRPTTSSPPAESTGLTPLKAGASGRLGRRAAALAPMAVAHSAPAMLMAGGGGGRALASSHTYQEQPAARMAAPTSAFLEADGRQLAAAGPKESPKIINEIKDYMLSTDRFWSELPRSVCQMHLDKSLGSWRNKQQQQQPAAKCFQEPLGLSDMNTDLRYRMEIQQQVHRLEGISAKIVDALRGVEIDWSNSKMTAADSGQKLPALPVTPSPVPPHSSVPAANLQPSSSPEGGDTEEDPDDESNGEALDEEVENGSTPVDEADERDPDYATAEPEIDPDEGDEEEETLAHSTESPTNAANPAEETDLTGQKPNPNLDLQNGLITAADQSPQKSSAGGVLVIHNQLQLLFGLSLACALSIVNYSHTTTSTTTFRFQ